VNDEVAEAKKARQKKLRMSEDSLLEARKKYCLNSKEGRDDKGRPSDKGGPGDKEGPDSKDDPGVSCEEGDFCIVDT
jgi:hypothetical protein